MENLVYTASITDGDITLICKDNISIKTYNCLLSSLSAYFSAKGFNEQMKRVYKFDQFESKTIISYLRYIHGLSYDVTDELIQALDYFQTPINISFTGKCYKLSLPYIMQIWPNKQDFNIDIICKKMIKEHLCHIDSIWDWVISILSNRSLGSSPNSFRKAFLIRSVFVQDWKRISFLLDIMDKDASYIHKLREKQYLISA